MKFLNLSMQFFVYSLLFLLIGLSGAATGQAQSTESTIYLPLVVSNSQQPIVPTLTPTPEPEWNYGYVAQEQIWRHLQDIPVCWVNPSPANTNEQLWVQTKIRNTWERHSRIRFVGWAQCSVTNQENAIRIQIADTGPHVKVLGQAIRKHNEGMVLNFTFQNWSQGCAAPESYRQFCIEAIAVHEFGHALSFAHEQNRPDTPSWCSDQEQGSNGSVLIGQWDRDSVMNYCNPQWNGSGNLSNGDILTLQTFYGTPLPTKTTTMLWSDNFSDPNGWHKDPAYYSTISFPDLNGDGKADLCGRGYSGMLCALSIGRSFTPVTLWSDNFSDPNGWHKDPAYYSTISFPDLNGDGKADLCGRGYSGMLCALSNGSSFSPVVLWSDNFSDPNGWHKDPAYYSTIQFPDLNGDGKADLCGRGYSGMLCALSNGSSFSPVVLWSDNFSDPNGWHKDPAYYSSIQFPDLNGDSKADLCGRGYSGMLCALSNGSSFSPVVLWSDNFSDPNGWHKDPAYYSTIQFPDLNGDGKADLCGRGYSGMLCALSEGSSFSPVVLWSDNFSDPNRWNSSPAYYRTIQFPDLNGDKKADLCGRGYSGILCAFSNGSAFTLVELWSDAFSDSTGWNTTRAYYKTIQFADLNGDKNADICGRGYWGVHCATITITSELATDNDFHPNLDGDSFQN